MPDLPFRASQHWGRYPRGLRHGGTAPTERSAAQRLLPELARVELLLLPEQHLGRLEGDLHAHCTPRRDQLQALFLDRYLLASGRASQVLQSTHAEGVTESTQVDPPSPVLH